ncbi:MAG: hypothetical protein IKR13_01405, partial [Victivallales bacterium]|nr:hypothetical protein [Victivallales bacterium]
IFAGAFLDSPQLQEALDVVHENGATVLFLYGAGFMTALGVDVTRLSNNVGIQLVETDEASLQVCLANGTVTGADYLVKPRFAVADAEALVLGNYTADGAVAVAQKGKSIFHGGAALEAQFVREVARQAGVHVYTDTDDNFFAGGNFLCIHSTSAGTKTIRLPHRADAVEIYTGEIIGEDTDCLEFPMSALETKVFFLDNKENILNKLKFNNLNNN